MALKSVKSFAIKTDAKETFNTTLTLIFKLIDFYYRGGISSGDFSFFFRFPGFSKSGPELYLLCKQLTKGKDKLSIYVGDPLIYIQMLQQSVRKCSHMFCKNYAGHIWFNKPTAALVISSSRHLKHSCVLRCVVYLASLSRTVCCCHFPLTFVFFFAAHRVLHFCSKVFCDACSGWRGRSSVVLPRNPDRLHRGWSQERVQDVRPQKLHRVPNHTQCRFADSSPDCKLN